MLPKFKQMLHARKTILEKQSEKSDEIEMEENIVHKVTLHLIFIFSD